MPPIKIAPSILSADFGNLDREIKSVEEYADLIHVDVMDGHFVPNITIGPEVVKCLKSKKPLDCHLMIENPERYVEDFAKAGASIITVHQEVCPDLLEIIEKIRKLGKKAGVSLKPRTPLEVLGEEVLNKVDLVLLMTVNPGFAGQGFMKMVLPKIQALRQKMTELDIEVDGGINQETAKLVKEAGANILVAGSYIFKSKNRKRAISSLR